MDPKYSNIFWHQGVKFFGDTVLKNKKGQIKVAHLENDVTKALINLFQYCSPKVLKALLTIISVEEAPEAFQFDFQVTDSSTYRQKPERIMLCIIAASTIEKSDPSYGVKKSQPDACIYSMNTAILVEAKTQSPLIIDQINAHIEHYLGAETYKMTITWEEISEKFMTLLDKKLQPILSFKNISWRTANVTSKSPATFSAFYFYDDDKNIHINKYPNINFNFDEYGMNLSFNSEIKSSMKYMLKAMEKRSEEFDKQAGKIDGFDCLLFFKIQYQPMDNFVWDLVPGFPVPMSIFKSRDIISAIDVFEEQWGNFKNTRLFQMKSGMIRHSSGRLYNAKEIEFASTKNKKPIYAMRISKQYPAPQIAEKKKRVFLFLKEEISKLKPLVELVVS